MDKKTIKHSFEKMGAPVVIEEVEPVENRFRQTPKFDINIRTNKDLGEHFHLRLRKDADIDIIAQDVRPKDRHMILKVKDKEPRIDEITSFLVGHDERHWFSAGVPGSPTTVEQAKNSLMPQQAERAVSKREKKKNKHKRHNKVYKRQGEWFFIPAPKLNPDKALILEPKGGEPIVRQGGGKPHMVQMMYREGGKSAWIRGDQTVSDAEFERIKKDNPIRAKMYRRGLVDAKVYVRGWVRHPDHATINLKGWHEVVPNTETTMSAGRSVRMSFID